MFVCSFQNRISEELFFIREAQNHHHQGHNHDGLVAKGEALVKQAKEVLAKHPHGREARSLEKEIADIEKLITAIRAKPAVSLLQFFFGRFLINIIFFTHPGF